MRPRPFGSPHFAALLPLALPLSLAFSLPACSSGGASSGTEGPEPIVDELTVDGPAKLATFMGRSAYVASFSVRYHDAQGNPDVRELETSAAAVGGTTRIQDSILMLDGRTSGDVSFQIGIPRAPDLKDGSMVRFTFKLRDAEKNESAPKDILVTLKD